MPDNRMRVTVRDARIILRNFSGTGKPMNQEGNRNFCVVIDDPAVAQSMGESGWNIKTSNRPVEEGQELKPFIQVTVKYRDINGQPVKPPRIVMMTSSGPRTITEENVSHLDNVDIAKADVIFQERKWEGGIKAYCKTLVIWIDEDELEIEHGLNSMVGAAVTSEETQVDGEA